MSGSIPSRRVRVFVALLTFAGLAACATSPNRVPVLGRERAVSRLVGSWEGEYWSEQTGRRGTISFTLRAGTDTAVGEVLMTETRREPDWTDDPGRLGIPRVVSPVPLLTIRFVQIDGGQVVGELDPYADPLCGSQLFTRFLGVMKRNVIDGSFRSDGSEIFHQPSTGSWRVHRVAADTARGQRER